MIALPNKKLSGLVLATALAAAASALAADLPPALLACTKESKPKDRLACYDREVAAVGGGDSANTAAMSGAPAKTLEERFGYRGEVAKEEAIRKKSEEPKLESISSKLARIVRRPQGPSVFTLENGQVWEQRAPDSMFTVDVGDEVTIKAAALGSFLLVSPRGRSTRVSRVR
jgi:hypothetical protein